MGTKKVKKTRQVRKYDQKTQEYVYVTETYYETVTTNDGGYSDYCGAGGDSGYSGGDGGSSCGE